MVTAMVATATNIGGRIRCILDGADWHRTAAINTEIDINKRAAVACGRIAASAFLRSLWHRRVGAVTINALSTIFGLDAVLMRRTFYVLTVVKNTLSIIAVLVRCAFNTVTGVTRTFT